MLEDLIDCRLSHAAGTETRLLLEYKVHCDKVYDHKNRRSVWYVSYKYYNKHMVCKIDLNEKVFL